MAKTYNTVPDKSVGDTFTEAMWDDYIKTNVNNLIVPPSCRVYKAAAQSINSGSDTAIQFDNERWDTDSMHDTVTNNTRITIQTAGIYLVTAGLGVTVATEVLAAMLRVNGSTYIARNQDAMTTSAFAQYVTVVAAYSFAAADYVELRALQDNTANTSRTTDTTFTWMSAVWLGKAS